MKQNRAFTLVEVMIALMILSITVVSLTGGQGLALRSAYKSRFMTMATLAAKNLMSDVEVNTAMEGFEYVKDLEETAEGNFDDEENEAYKGWQWKREVKEVKIPLATIIKAYMSSSQSDPTAAAGADQQYVNLLADSIEKIMKESMREITVTVYWPTKAGKEFSELSIVYYATDLNVVNSFTPGV